MKLFARPEMEEHGDQNIFWASMSDLMLGLLIVFIVLFVFAMMGFSKQDIETKKTQKDISEKIEKELKSENVTVEMDKYSGIIKISNLELFELNSYTISPKGKAYLNKIIPVYLNSLLKDPKIRQNIDSIIIEGHTDSQGYKSASSKYDNYAKNLDLSAKRANAIADYIVRLNYPDKNLYKDDLIKLLSANGRSFSEPILDKNGKEDYNKSRRVELKFRLKENKFVDLLKKQH